MSVGLGLTELIMPRRLANWVGVSGRPVLLRMLGMRQNLGELKVAGLDQIEPGVVEISGVTANEGAATMKVLLDTSPSPKIKGIQMMVGG